MPPFDPPFPSGMTTTSRATHAANLRNAEQARRRATGDPIVPHPSSSDREYSADEEEFIRAMDGFRSRTGRKFPTLCETLAVLVALGYRKIEPETRDHPLEAHGLDPSEPRPEPAGPAAH